MSDQEIVNTMVAIARDEGCNCDPEVGVVHDDEMPNIINVQVCHDDWCILLRRRNASNS